MLYATPTQEQVDTFWSEVNRSLAEPIEAGVFYRNQTKHLIELSGTQQRVRAKTAWDANSLRGDYADLLILDEYQLMKQNAWDEVGAPMLLDNDGDAVFIYTTKRGRHHSKELFKKAAADVTGRWASFVFSSFDNPFINRAALAVISTDMTRMAYRMEILALEDEDDPRALWNRQEMIEKHRVVVHPTLVRVVIGVDPPGTEEGAECGIIVGGLGDNGHGYVIQDRSLQGSPATWGGEVVTGYQQNKADRVVAEVNFGGDMVESTIRTIQGGERVSFKAVRASRGKAVRAEPVAALYERGMIHHVGQQFVELEDQLCTWVPGEGDSPDRLDALVWAFSELMLEKQYAPPRFARYA